MEKRREKTNIESEPGPGSAKQHLSVLPLTEVVAEVGPRGFGDFDLMGDKAVIGSGFGTLPVSVDVPDGLLHVTLDIESETGGLRDCKSEVESNAAGDASETDEETPAVVDGLGVGR